MEQKFSKEFRRIGPYITEKVSPNKKYMVR